ncbi:MAG: alanine--tRNA ligase [PVC group bacterium]|nr:alanine--tRNA ligase [PVC group bacterium]
MKSNEVRSKFLKFFKSKDHKIAKSDSLVPQNDPSVLFTSAGMNQFKEQFMGKITDFSRAASSQKCMRTADLVNVGKSPTHHTFFEMLGNFSFGDYFKTEAISWAWEFVTKVLSLPKERLWISVYHKDQEAYDIWTKTIKIPKERIVKLGDKDNFWPANAPTDGPNGPCGPCSEIFYDWTENYGCKKPDCNPACDCGRFTEIWNLVFTQYNRQSDGSLNPLPSKNIDTGMGLERITSVMQDKRENYDTDLFVPIINAIKENLKRENITPDNAWLDSQAKAIADHIRAVTFAITDGVIPSNESRGYVIRKLIRRSIMYLKQTGFEKPFCYKLVYVIADNMKEPYPEVLERHENIAGILKKEEEMFWAILKERAPQADEAFKALVAKSKNGADAAQLAFNQYDTFGVPLEISKEIARKYNLVISDDDFEKEMDKQRERSRSGTQIAGEIFAKTTGHLIQGIKSDFIGYDSLSAESKVIAIIKNDALVDEAEKNEEVDIILAKTPFYAEAGGQIGDTGLISADDFSAEVINTIKVDAAILHRVKIKKGTIKKGSTVLAEVNKGFRFLTMRNHTATHILQYALRKTLGKNVEQSGSYVTPEKLRFDFTHLEQLSPKTIAEIENLVNECIWDNYPVHTNITSINEAKEKGALAFFQEKYGDTVRVVSVENHSQELCGGTHVNATGEIGLFKITSESSIAQGIRRIEAVTSKEAFNRAQEKEKTISEISRLFKTSPENLISTAQKLAEQVKTQEKELAKHKKTSASQEADTLLDSAQNINNIAVIIKELKNYDMDALRKICDRLKSKTDNVICVLASTGLKKPLLIVGLSSSLAKKGLDAVTIIKEITAIAGGGGGGKKDLAQAGTKDEIGLRKALDQSKQIVEKFLNQGFVLDTDEEC